MNTTFKPLSDERLAEIGASHAAYVARHTHVGAFACCSAHASADTVPELLAERHALAKRAAELEDERDDAQSDYAVMGSDLIGVYRERAHLVALLAALYPSELREDPEDEDGEWSIVYIDLPTGQASWHIHPRDMDLFPHVKFGTDAEWDGHSTEEKYQRIAKYTADIAGKAGAR